MRRQFNKWIVKRIQENDKYWLGVIDPPLIEVVLNSWRVIEKVLLYFYFNHFIKGK